MSIDIRHCMFEELFQTAYVLEAFNLKPLSSLCQSCLSKDDCARNWEIRSPVKFWHRYRAQFMKNPKNMLFDVRFGAKKIQLYVQIECQMGYFIVLIPNEPFGMAYFNMRGDSELTLT